MRVADQLEHRPLRPGLRDRRRRLVPDHLRQPPRPPPTAVATQHAPPTPPDSPAATRSPPPPPRPTRLPAASPRSPVTPRAGRAHTTAPRARAGRVRRCPPTRCTRKPLRRPQQRSTTDTSTSSGAAFSIPHTNAADPWLTNAPFPQAISAARPIARCSPASSDHPPGSSPPGPRPEKLDTRLLRNSDCGETRSRAD